MRVGAVVMVAGTMTVVAAAEAAMAAMMAVAVAAETGCWWRRRRPLGLAAFRPAALFPSQLVADEGLALNESRKLTSTNAIPVVILE